MSEQSLLEAERYDQLAEQSRHRAKLFHKAAESEAGLAGLLKPLEEHGWTMLEDRMWPGSKRANIDFLLIGPPGIVIVDAKDWSEPRLIDNVLYRGQAEASDEVDKLDSLVETIRTLIEPRGLTPTTVSAAMVFTGRSMTHSINAIDLLGDKEVFNWFLSMRPRLPARDVRRLIDVVAEACPTYGTASQVMLPIAKPVMEVSQDALPGLEDISEALIATALQGPIESWMTFLHPEQNQYIRAHVNGAARLSGAAGSGKTSVALHRACYLAERSTDPLLFVSYVKTLPRVMSNLAAEINPRVAPRIEFTGVHALAFECLRRVGRKIKVAADQLDGCFHRAWASTPSRARLVDRNASADYWKDEINYVIKGRGLTSFERYADLKRVGRQTKLNHADREAVWELLTAYQRELRTLGVLDWNDLLIEAREAVMQHPSLFEYGGVVVDEAQDLTMVGLTFLAALAGDGPNRLLVVGDGQQNIYPGGFSLQEAGVHVVGRSTILRTNYRNTREILDTARTAIAHDLYTDIEGVETKTDSFEAIRSGTKPTIVTDSLSGIDRALVDELRRLASDEGVAAGDMAVLLPTRAQMHAVRKTLLRHSVPTMLLEDYEGISGDAVKVGTIKRAKGLEFKAVFLPRADVDGPSQRFDESDDAFAERRALSRRELYVAMTRARDHLWIGCPT